MDLVASGMNNHHIASTCFIGEKMVKNYINQLLAKLHSASRPKAAVKWPGTALSSATGLR
ncbi:LuxR C-terminal-related transcriptional regulator [Streptomyces blattellae]|uniref:LuxR C-terminal-related transcriptional regulator n=1 Tax=Streptomyces blattellae TaxID=2569855 RepID=UPI0038B692FF